MLVLSRKMKETIVIDGSIRVTVVAVKGNVVQLGIEAPRETSVHRREVYERIQMHETAFASAR